MLHSEGIFLVFDLFQSVLAGGFQISIVYILQLDHHTDTLRCPDGDVTATFSVLFIGLNPPFALASQKSKHETMVKILFSTTIYLWLISLQPVRNYPSCCLSCIMMELSVYRLFSWTSRPLNRLITSSSFAAFVLCRLNRLRCIRVTPQWIE